MIFKEKYTEFCKEMLESGFDKSNIVDYEKLKEYWDEMFYFNNNKFQKPNIESEELQLSYLFSLRWGSTSLCTSNKILLPLSFSILFSSISNTIFSIIKLAIDGFDSQANILIRNLHELCFTMLSIIIDPIKRNAFIDCSKDNEYKKWNTYFRFKELNKTINDYLNKNNRNDLFLNTWMKNYYSNFSSYVHNDFFSIFLNNYAFTKNKNDFCNLNLWGSYASRTDIITSNINSILWFTESMFERLLTDKCINFYNNKELLIINNKEIWNLSMFVGLFTKKYYMQILSKK
jgi:hypothetical protein